MSLSNKQVAIFWWEGLRETAKSSNGNFWFSGDTIYSYRTPIAHKLPGCVLITSQKYSKTTSSKHMPGVSRYAWCGRGVPKFYVHDVCPVGERDHQSNLTHLIQEYTDVIATARRTRKAHPNDLMARVRGARREVEEYATMFSLEWTPPAEPDPKFKVGQLIRHREGTMAVVDSESPMIGFVHATLLVEGYKISWRSAHCTEVRDV